MSWRAGQRITAARLSQELDGTDLSSTTPGTAATWTQWGSETVVFPNPGVPVKVKAELTGRTFRSTASNSNVDARLAISLDGGANFTTSNPFTTNAGNVAGSNQRAAMARTLTVSGTPTGDIVIKAECQTSVTSTDFANGRIDAQVIPQ